MKRKVVAVSLYPSEGRVRETEFWRADGWRTGKNGNLIIDRDGEAIATYDKNIVKSIRFSSRAFSHEKVRFVRRFVRAKVRGLGGAWV